MYDMNPLDFEVDINICNLVMRITSRDELRCRNRRVSPTPHSVTPHGRTVCMTRVCQTRIVFHSGEINHPSYICNLWKSVWSYRDARHVWRITDTIFIEDSSLTLIDMRVLHQLRTTDTNSVKSSLWRNRSRFCYYFRLILNLQIQRLTQNLYNFQE